jgi:hypothetical protein
LPAVEENATNDWQRRDEVCLVMAVNDGGVPPILAQKHCAQPSAFTPENLLREARRQVRQKPVLCFAHVTNQMGRIDGDFEKGEADGSHDALQLIAGDRLRSRLLP